MDIASPTYDVVYVLQNCDLILEPEKYYSITINSEHGSDNFVGKCVSQATGKREIQNINVEIFEASIHYFVRFILIQDPADNTTKLCSRTNVHGLPSIDIKEVPEIYYLCYANRVSIRELSNRIANIEKQLKTSSGTVTA